MLTFPILEISMKKLEKNKAYDGVVFKKMNVVGDTLLGIEFENCRFISCKFSESKFDNCKFIDCKFEMCNLNIVKFTKVSLVDALFKKCKLSGIDFSDLIGVTKSMDLVDCDFKYIVFMDIDLKDRKIKDCIAQESNFIKVDLQNADFSGTDLKGTRFEDCDISGANFIEAKNYFIDTSCNKITKAKFSMPEAASLLENLDIVIK